MRYSPQRDEILRYLRSVKCHPTAEVIYEKVKAVMPKISLGTVYRNLKVLVDNGDIIKIDSDNNMTNYDGNVGEHEHFICTKCKGIFDVHLKSHKLECDQEGFNVTKEHIVLYGVCAECNGKI